MVVCFCSRVLQIQRTPLVVRTGGATFMNNMNHPQQSNTDWTQSSHRPAPTGTHSKSSSHRPSYVNYTNPTGERSSRSGTTSRSTSANEVEHMLMNQQQLSRPSVPSGGGWRTTALQAPPPIQRNSKYHPLIYRSIIPQYLLSEY